jgi:hypothetical protein
MPRGVYLGFTPSVTPGSDVLTLNVDSDHNFSLLKVPSKDETVAVDIFTADPVVLDFEAHNVWPVFVLATASYRATRPTQAQIFTRASGPSSINEIIICKVDKPADDLVIETTLPSLRQPPVAFQTQPYGYMPDGSIDALAATNATVAEVVAARSSTYTGPHGSLKDRLDADMDGTSLAGRLGLRMVHLISNSHPSRTGTSPNVSGSFSSVNRDIAPNFLIEPNGDETTEGAITDGARNFCFVIDTSTGQRLIDSTTKKPVYGVTSFFSAGIGVGKEVHFVNASTSVNGNGTNPFQAPLEEGDTVEGPDGLFYEIVSFTDPDNAVLGDAFQGSDGFITNPLYRRWLLFLFTVGGGPYNMVAPTNIRFVFPCFFRVDRAIFDGYLLIKRNGERPQLPLATTSEQGKALLAVDGGLVGAFSTIKNSGSSIGGDVHTLNFTSGGATNAGGGIVAVAVPGSAGPAGPSANQGDDGPTGAAGFGYSTLNSFEVSPETSNTFTAGGPVTLSFTQNWGTGTPVLVPTGGRRYAHVSGGWATINGFEFFGFERIHIDTIADVDNDTTRIQMRIQPDGNQSLTTVKCYMGASQ